MADNDIARRGYMNVIRNPKEGMVGQLRRVTSRRFWVVLRKSGVAGTSRLELYRSEDQRGDPIRIINLDSGTVRSVETAERKRALVLHLPDEACMFQCASRADMEDWYRDILSYRSGGKPPIGSRNSLLGMAANSGEIYEVVPDDETFSVTLRKSNSIMFSGPCLLEILRDFDRNLFHIAIFTDDKPPRLVVKWQIDHIRQYGSNQMAFKFESGSKSSTGVDWFIVDTDPGAAVRIHKAVDYWAKHIVEQVRNMPFGGGSGRSRGNTLPQQQRTPVSPPPGSSSSLPNHGDSNGLSSGFYQPLTPQTQMGSSVYETCGSTNERSSNKNKVPKPKPVPLANDGSTSLYQPLTASTNTSNTQQVYQPLTRNTPTSAHPPPLPLDRSGGGINRTTSSGSTSSGNNSVYQPLTNRTEQPQHYMGLDEVVKT